MSVLDTFFLVNLGVLSLVTLYNRISGGSQYAAVCVSAGSAFAVFCLILLNHCRKRLLSCYSSCKKYTSLPLEMDSAQSENSDEEILNIVDEDRDCRSLDKKMSDVSIELFDTY